MKKEIKINRNEAIKKLTGAIRDYVLSAGLSYRVYLWDDGDLTVNVFCDDNSWSESDHIVCEVAHLTSNPNPILFDWVENNKSSANAIKDWVDVMPEDEKAKLYSYRDKFPDVDDESLAGMMISWCHDNAVGAQAILLDYMMDEVTSDSDSGLCPNAILDDCIIGLEYDGYSVDEE